jgi:transcriptional regulator with XRE-family HTH domain
MEKSESPGDRIAQALRSAQMRPVELARQLKLSQPTIHGWVNSQHGITWSNVRRAAKALGVSPSWIMFGADEEAERLTQTKEELTFLRLFRELADEDQVAALRLLSAMIGPRFPRAAESQLAPAKKPSTSQTGCITNIPLRKAAG